MNKDAGAATGNMLQELWVESQLTRTENGALTYASTGKDCLDLFASIGAMRNSSDDEIRVRFMRAFAENPDVAMDFDEPYEEPEADDTDDDDTNIVVEDFDEPVEE